MRNSQISLLGFLTLILFSIPSFSQTELPDSIAQLLTTKVGELQANGLLKAAHFYYNKDDSKYIQYSSEFEKFDFNQLDRDSAKVLNTRHSDFLLETFQYPKGIEYLNFQIKSARKNKEFENAALLHKLIFPFFYFIFEYDSCSYHLDKSISIYKELDKQREIGELTIRKSAVSYAKGNYEEAIDLADQSIKLFKKSGNNDKLALAYLQLGNIFYFLSDYTNSKEYYTLSYNSFVKQGNDAGKYRALSNIGLVNIKLKNYEKSIDQQRKALNYFKKGKKELEKANALHFLSSGYFFLNQLDSAKYYNKIAIKSDHLARNIIGLGEGFLMNAKIFKKENKLAQALVEAKKSYQIADSMQHFETLKNVILEMAFIYEELNEIDSSHRFLKMHYNLMDSLDINPKKLRDYALKHQFNLEKAHFELLLAKEETKRQELEHEKHRRQLVIASLIATFSLLLLALAIIILLRNKRLSKELADKRNLIESELEIKESLLNEIHHRVKNNLQVISSMLSLQTQYISDSHIQKVISDCKSRINSMSLIHESLYKKTDGLETPFSTYVKNLIPQLIDTYKVDESKIKSNMDLKEIYLNLDESIPCGLLINEIVSNSLKHAFPNERNGKINLKLWTENNHICLTIADDGIGFNSEEEIKNQDSFGFLLIETLVKQLEAEMKLTNRNGVHYDIRWSSIS